MKMILSQHVRSSFLWTLLLVVLVGFVGAGHFGMAVDAQGEMSRCPIMGVSAVCQMNPLEHIAEWQKLFTVPPQKDMLALLLLALVAISASAVLGVWDFLRGADASAFRLLAFRRAEILPIGRTLQEAFSNGILNPKIF